MEGEDFGSVMSMNTTGNRIAFGARLHSGIESFSGYARVFELQNGSWVQLGSDMVGVAFEALGTAVSLNAAGNIFPLGHIMLGPEENTSREKESRQSPPEMAGEEMGMNYLHPVMSNQLQQANITG